MLNLTIFWNYEMPYQTRHNQPILSHFEAPSTFEIGATFQILLATIWPLTFFLRKSIFQSLPAKASFVSELRDEDGRSEGQSQKICSQAKHNYVHIDVAKKIQTI